MLKSLFTRTGPTVAATKVIVLGLIRQGPLSQKDMNDALHLALPGVDCNVFADAVTELMRDRKIAITNGAYALAGAPSF